MSPQILSKLEPVVPSIIYVSLHAELWLSYYEQYALNVALCRPSVDMLLLAAISGHHMRRPTGVLTVWNTPRADLRRAGEVPKLHIKGHATWG